MRESLQHYQILNLYTVSNSKGVKLTVNIWVSLHVCKTFKVFMDAMKYTLFEVTITRLTFLHQFLLLKISSGSEQKW